MMNTTLDSNQSNLKKTDETSTHKLLDEPVLTWHMTCDDRQKDGVDNYKAVTTAVLLDRVIDNLSAANKFSLTCQSAVNDSTTDLSEHFLKCASKNHNSTADRCESFPEQVVDHFNVVSTVPNTTNYVTAQDNQQHEKHIIISYNSSSRDICQKIYDRLIEKNYKVWMHLSDMGDDILVSMARAVENSYIVLLCINQQYYTSEYCRLEAEYATEKRIKCIPCLMEKSFQTESWLGSIKGSNFHIDFSSHDNFDRSFDELIRQITYVEKRLSLPLRRTATSCSMINSIQSVRMSTSDTIISSFTNNADSRRFDDIVCKYKKSISKEHYELNQLQQNELSSLIIKLREELYCDAPQVLSDSKKSDDVIEKHHCGNNCLKQTRNFHQNDILRLVDRLTTPKPMEENNSNSFFIGCFKSILGGMVVCMLHRCIIRK
ncbi:unnamed protein product [Rotaria sp. Silwood1]|nr:unnamed protein product [Rotaria sp. Silwood1]CAF3627370.1 unnamed protein product [Rotaria sp. Silwood1]